MSYVASQDLRGKHPIHTVGKLVTTDNNRLYNGSGSLMDTITSSFALNAKLPGMTFATTPPSTSSVNETYIYGTVDTLCTRPHATLKLNNKLYAGTWDGYLYVFNDPDNDLTNITSASFASGDCADVCYSSASGFLYFLNDAGQIIKVDPNNLASQTLFYGSGTGGLGSIRAFGNYIYLTNHGLSNTSSFVKLDVSNSSVVDGAIWVSASVVIGHAHTMDIDNTGQYIYAASDIGYAVKVDTSNLSVQVNAPYIGASFTDDSCVKDNYYYAADESGGAVYQFNTSDMSINATSAALGGSYGVFTDDTHVYGLSSGTNRIVIFYNGDVSSPIIFDVAPHSPNELWITDGGKYIFTSWPSSTVVSANFPMTQIGINTNPSTTLDVFGGLNVLNDITSSTLLVSGSMTCNTNITTKGILSFNTLQHQATSSLFRVLSTGRTLCTSSISASLGFSDRRGFQTFTTIDALTSSIAVKATNSNNSFIFSVFDNGDGTGTLTLIQAGGPIV